MKLLFINGSRGEWGYIRPIIDICKDENIDYSICGTNMLMLNSHGNLLDEIVEQGYIVSDKIYMSLEGDNHYSMVKSLGIFLTSFVDTIVREKPDWVILAGDRGEQLVGAIAAAYTYTPVAHIQAGERSGNIDGVARHAIGKFVHLHFASNLDAAGRLKKLGEEDFRIHNVGAPQLDELHNTPILTKEEILNKLGIENKNDFLLIVQHSVTEDYNSAEDDSNTLIHALDQFQHSKIWILPNNDAGSRKIRDKVLSSRKNNYYIFDNLTRLDYLSLLSHCICIVGNSSSGLLEAPTYKTPAVNIGRRQKDRVQGENVINCEYDAKLIKDAIKKAISPEFNAAIRNISNPYGKGDSSLKIIDILRKTKIDDNLLIKRLTY